MATTLQAPELRSSQTTESRIAGLAAIAGAVAMLVGAVLWAASGADLDAALADGTMAEYLVEAADNSALLTANLAAWIFGVLLLGIGGILLSRLGRDDSAAGALARFAYTAGPAAAIVFFSIWLGIVRGLAPAHMAGEPVTGPATALGYAATIADWVATVLIVGVGAAAVAYGGRGAWVPRWLFNWAMVALATGGLAIVALLAGVPALGLPIVPVGLGWTIAAGITAVRHGA